MDFQPKDHLMQIKNKNGASDYLPVQWRLVWFREVCPDGSITTELVHLDLDRETEEEGYSWNNETKRSEKIVKRAQGIAIFRATIKDGKGGEATGTKMEKAASFGDFLEKAETGSIGRALAALGYGTQFAPELSEEARIVDAPVAPSGNDKLAEVKARFGKLFKSDRWEPFKVNVLGLPVADEGLSDSELAKLNVKLIEIEKQNAAKSAA